MKKLATFTMLVLLATWGMAQTYTGSVQDQDQLPIAYADVVAKDKNTHEVIHGVMTDDNGNFKLKVNRNASFYIEVSYWSYEPYKITPKNENIGVITLKSQSIQLKGVTATARKKVIEQKPDRMVFNVENSVVSSGGDALDVLRNTPSVNVKNEGIEIIGKQGVRVMVNDRMIQLSGEDLVSYLGTLSSDDIKSIEVITTPPSKYDAEGNGGLINIVLKTPKENSWSNQIRTSYIQTTYPAFNLGNTFNYSKGKWRIVSAINAKKGHENSTIKSDVYYPDALWEKIIQLKQKEDYLSGRLGVDYNVSSNATVGVLYSGRVSDPDNISYGKTFIINKGIQQGEIISKGYSDDGVENHSLNAHYIQKLDTLGRKLSVDVDYFTFNKNQNRLFSNEMVGVSNGYLKANNFSDQKVENYSAKLDMEHPFSWANVSYGAKFTQTNTNSLVNYYDVTSGTPQLDPKQSDNFHFKEKIGALYVDMAKNFGKKWQTKVGLRMEHTRTQGISQTTKLNKRRKYTQYFPTAYVSYMQSPNHIFNLSYSKRVKRPSFWALNPFRWYVDANSYTVGNPSLKPEIENNFEFKYIYKSKFITEVFANFMDNGYAQSIRVNEKKNQIVYTQENFFKGVAYGMKETILYNPFKWWRTTTQASIFIFDTSYDNDIYLGAEMLKGWNFGVYTNQIFTLNSQGTVQAEATFFYSSPAKQLMFESSASHGLDIGLKMFFYDKKLQLTVAMNDIFKGKAPNHMTNTNGIRQVYNTYYDTRYLKVGLSYKFGNKKISIKERDLGNESEINRIQ